jgi:hypothetical protein
MIWNKNNNDTWDMRGNDLDMEDFMDSITKLKTYSKFIKASAYTVTNTLDDVYNILNHQHIFWVTVAEGNKSVYVASLNLHAHYGSFYNILMDHSEDAIIENHELRDLLNRGVLKAANANLFKSTNTEDVYWFQTYNPLTSDTTGYEHLVIKGDYTSDSWRKAYNESEKEYGYTIKNVFTSEKVLSKMLRNFNVVDVASSEHVDVYDSNGKLAFYPILNLDETVVNENSSVLLLNQNDATENGVYTYKNQHLVFVPFGADDVDMFSAYVKEGAVAKNKEYFVKRKQDGTFPEPGEGKQFEEGNNYILRNRISYKLIQNHVFNDLTYHTHRTPETETDFSNTVTMGEVRCAVDLRTNSLVCGETQYSLSDGQTFSDKLSIHDGKLYGLYFIYSDVNEKIYNLFRLDAATAKLVTVKDFLMGDVIDFDITSDRITYLTAHHDTHKVLEDNISGNASPSILLDSPVALVDFELLRDGGDTFLFYLTKGSLNLWYKGQAHHITDTSNPASVRLGVSGGTVTIEWLSNHAPVKREITLHALRSLLAWEQGDTYAIESKSKLRSGDWAIEDGHLTLKGVRVTGLTEAELAGIPKINNGKGYYFDGKNNYAELPEKTISKLRDSKSATVEFTLTPDIIKVDMPVIYLGDKAESVKYSDNGVVFDFQTLPSNYLTFSLSDENELPYMRLCVNGKVLDVKSNRKLIKGERVHVSFTWDYTETKATGKLYFDGRAVGTVVDQKSVLTANEPLDITKINFVSNFIGKSESEANPFFKGMVYELRLWRGVLNPSQVLTRFDRAIAANDILRERLLAYFRMEDKASKLLDDVNPVNAVFNGGLGGNPSLGLINGVVSIMSQQDVLYVLTPDSMVFTIDLKTEEITRLYTSGTPIKSFNHDGGTLYVLEGNAIKEITGQGKSVDVVNIYTDKVYLDFVKMGEHVYIYKEDDKLYDAENRVVYENTTGGFESAYIGSDANGCKVYLECGGETLLLNRRDGDDRFEWVTTFPLSDNASVVVGAAEYTLSENVVYKDGVGLDQESLYWNVNLDRVFGVYDRKGSLLVGVITNDGAVQLWGYQDGRYTRYMNSENHYTLFHTDDACDLCYYTNNGEEYIVAMDTKRGSLRWYMLSGENKVSWLTDSWEYQIALHGRDATMVDFVNGAITVITREEGVDHVFTVSNATGDYTMFRNTLTHAETTQGIIVGESGLMFRDGFAQDWELTRSEILYKENFTAVDAHISLDANDKGYITPAWSGLLWVLGENGRLFKSVDNGETWGIINTGVKDMLNAMAFVDERNGIIVGDNNVILSTTSGGSSFTKLAIPESVGFQNWNSVLHYASNRVIVVGDGGRMLHMTKVDNNWAFDDILNDVPDVAGGATDKHVRLVYKDTNDSDTYANKLNDIISVGDMGFLAVGDRGLLVHVTLRHSIDYVVPVLNFIQTGHTENFKRVQTYVDAATNERRALVLTDSGLVEVPWDRWEEKDGLNVHNLPSTTRHTFNTPLKSIQVLHNDTFLGVGQRVTVMRESLQSALEDRVEYHNMQDAFVPKMLFLDYYIARKINLHLEDGTHEVPRGTIPKGILECYHFNVNDYVEFKPHGTVNRQNNFMAYQDYYLLNRRLMDGGLNTGGMEPWRAYNKRFTSVSPEMYGRYLWAGKVKADSGYEVVNEIHSTDYTRGLKEDITATKITVRDTDYTVSDGDVLRVTVLRSDNNVKPKIGDTVMLRVKNPLFELNQVGVIGEDDVLEFRDFKFVDWAKNENTYRYLEGSMGTDSGYIAQTVKPVCLRYINSLMEARCLTSAEMGDITVELNTVSYDTVCVATNIAILTGAKKLTINELWSGDMIEDFQDGTTLVVKNLNYFVGDLTHLKNVVSEHLVGESYEIGLTEPDNIVVSGRVTDRNVYYNLETVLEVSRDNQHNPITEYGVAYSTDFAYSPNYDIESFLRNIDSDVFNAEYTFKNMPSVDFVFNNVEYQNGSFYEFTITKNKIYAGRDNGKILRLKAGTFIDVVQGGIAVERVYINRVETTNYTNYPDAPRYIIHTDVDLETKFRDGVGIITLRTRNKLSEVSKDLEFTDNKSFPLPNSKGDVFTRTYYNQMKSSSAYASFIMNDDNIRKHVSAVVFMDESEDWVVGINDWKGDPNLDYRPVDLFELGIDRVFKKGITIEPDSYELSGSTFTLRDVDFSKYNFTLVDGLSLKNLEDRYHWVLNADIKNATIGEDSDGLVWYGGEWFSGIWEGGKFLSGKVYDVEWIGGDLYSYTITNDYNLIKVDTSTLDVSNTIWYNGVWLGGNWHAGTWRNGKWHRGTHHAGDWGNGKWYGGVWKSGNFNGGDWYGGQWLSGNFTQNNAIAVWHNGLWLGGDFENGVWKNGVWDKTDRIPSRFGTKASPLKNAIWEYGLWKNGEFHSGLNLKDGKPTVSETYNNSKWYNGVWLKGEFYGGVWKMGRWVNGVWHQGVFNSTLSIKTIHVRDLDSVQIRFNEKHFFKDIQGMQNYFTIIGKPQYVKGLVDNKTEFLGYNAKPVTHTVREIVDEYTLLVGGDTSFAESYLGAAPLPTPQTRCETDCVDYTLVDVEEIRTVVVPMASLNYTGTPLVVSHWANGTWHSGIWYQGYFNNGTWRGGMWLDGLFENGVYGD